MAETYPYVPRASMVPAPPGRPPLRTPTPQQGPMRESLYDLSEPELRAAAQQGDPGAAQVLKEYLIAEQEHQQRLNRSPIVHAGFGEKEVAQTLGNQAMASGADSEAFRRVEENRRVAWPGDRPTPQVSADPRGDMLSPPPPSPSLTPDGTPRPAGPAGVAPPQMAAPAGVVGAPAGAGGAPAGTGAPDIGIKQTPIAASSGPDKWDNMLTFGLNLMAAGDATPGAAVGPSLAGALGRAGIATRASVKADKAAAAAGAKDAARYADQMNLERKKLELESYKITQDGETKRLLHKINQDNDRFDKELGRQKLATEVMLKISKVRGEYAEVISNISMDPAYTDETSRRLAIQQTQIEANSVINQLMSVAGVPPGKTPGPRGPSGGTVAKGDKVFEKGPGGPEDWYVK